MSKMAEMIATLVREGMQADHLPVGMLGGPKASMLRGIRMKCHKATLFAKMQGDYLIEFEKTLPYGFLHVEAPELETNTIVALKHKLDFFHAWALNEKGLFQNEDTEVHVTHKKASGLKAMLRGIYPQFEYMVFNRGLFADLSNPRVREFALEEKPVLRLYGLEREENR